jgi:hypothetical protein
MSRRGPAAIRRDRQLRAYERSHPERIDGLSAAGSRIVDQLELKRRRPGETASALRCYRRFGDPAHRRWDDRYGCGVEECCPDPRAMREWLEIVVHHLPRRDRQLLQARVDAIEARWRAY